MNAMFSNFGSDPSWSPYQGPVVEDAIAFHQGNHFRSNAYRGGWRFLARDQSTVLSMSQWQGWPMGQDAGSTIGS